MNFQSENDFIREELIDKATQKLLPVREVVDDHTAKDFPKIRDCSTDHLQNTFEADPEDCSCYFVCTGKYYAHRKCSPGLLFDASSHDCNWPEVVECGRRPTPWAVPEYMGPHNIHQHYNIYEYTNTKLNRDRSQTDRWGDSVDDDELFM